MKELNPNIRQAVYNMLIFLQLSESKEATSNQNYNKYLTNLHFLQTIAHLWIFPKQIGLVA